MGDDEFDVVVVGAGFAGLYALHRLRDPGLRAVVLEQADGVGGTWYWNRYPGARCDIVSVDYSYSFDAELEREWRWSEKYATQPEILRYLEHVTDRFDLRRDIRFGTRVVGAAWDAEVARWRITTAHGDGAGGGLTCRFYVMATGCLSVPKQVDVPGVERFRGDMYQTSRWPHERVDFTGRRVAVIGTGSSAIQSIPLIAAEAAHTTVYQRTPAFSFPAGNGPIPAERLAAFEADPVAYREAARCSPIGVPATRPDQLTFTVAPEERTKRYEEIWQAGELVKISSPFADTLLDPAANDDFAEFVRARIRAIVDDPATAERLCPTSYPVGTKRPCLDTHYYATFNRPDVDLVDLRETPITRVTETGIDAAEGTREFDAIVLATGFDAMTGAIVAVDIAGRGGRTLRDAWADGPRNYLGLMSAGFPNLFMITGPGSPSVLSNMVVSIEQHVDLVADLIARADADGAATIEPTDTAERAWVRHVDDLAGLSLFPRADSWYMGANVPGKPRVFLPYLGGVDRYRAICEEVVDRELLGFAFDGPTGRLVHDGVVRPLMPDVQLLLDVMATLDLPDFATLPVGMAREMFDAIGAQRPPGPEVGEIVDGALPGAAGELEYRLYRPAAPGLHPVVVYFHGGGWVLGSHVSDDPLCRDLCVRSGAVLMSVNYRHAPEAVFPAAVDDAWAAVRWVAASGSSLGLDASRLAVAGWSAGANLAAVVSQLARDSGGPQIAGQALLCPVTGSRADLPSFAHNAEGYVLTSATMNWFWSHYAGVANRTDARLAPVHGNLAGLPPAIVVTAEFDPLRDDGNAYAEALRRAGVDVEHVEARGQIHTSIPAVGQLPTGAPYRERIAAALRRCLDR